MIYAEILAGGSGKRMGKTEMPKQFLNIGSKPILIHTIEQFVLNSRVDKIIVCVHPDWVTHAENLIEKHIIDSNEIYIVEGGATRNETVINGCRFIKKEFGLKDEDVIISHDSVRPFISQKIINNNIDAVLKYDAVDTVVPATDTIVESIDGKKISDIPLRDKMYQGQTPQSFNIKKLLKTYENSSEEQLAELTDTCKLMLINNYDVHIVEGEYYNIKITTQHDLKVANVLIGSDRND